MSHTHAQTHTVGLIGERKASDKYTAAGCGSLPLSLDTYSPEHLLDPVVGPVSSWIRCPSDISAKITWICTWSLFLEHRQKSLRRKLCPFFFQAHHFEVFLDAVSKYKNERKEFVIFWHAYPDCLVLSCSLKNKCLYLEPKMIMLNV